MTIRQTWISWLLAFTSFAASSCNVEFPAHVQACGEGATEVRVNERADQDEFTGHPLASATLGNGRALVAFSAMTFDNATGEPLTSEVRIALTDPATGARFTVCDIFHRERAISRDGAFAFAASVAPVDLIVGGRSAVALVAWTEGRFPASFLQMQFVDGAGCPLAISFRPYAGPVFASSITWSEQQHAVLATFHDERSVYRAWLRDEGPADVIALVPGNSSVYGFPMSAVAADGSALVVWADYWNSSQGMILDAAGNPRIDEATGVSAASFPIELPLIADTRVNFSLSVAAADRFAVAAEERALDRSVPARVMVREYALDGTALGQASFLDTSDPQEQTTPALRYTKQGALVAVWDSKAAGGTVGRLFGTDGAARFNTVSCDDGRFDVGARAETQLGFPSLLMSNGQMLVFHSAQGGGDPQGSATFMWEIPFADLWPGPQ